MHLNKKTKMTKHLTITLPDHIFEKCIAHFSGNRSQYIGGLIDKGFDAENDVMDSLRSHNTKMKQELYNNQEEIRKLKAEIGRLKKQIKPEESPEEIRARQFHKGRRMAGLNRKLADKMEF